MEPAKAMLVGERIDNKIVQARMLGMTGIRFVTGRHADQQQRSWAEVSDADVDSVVELDHAIHRYVESTPASGGPEHQK